jgi:hypothetical protein
MRAKTFVVTFFAISFVFVSFHLLAWKFETQKIYSGEYRVGDLGSRIGFVPSSIDYRHDFTELSNKHVDSFKATQVQLQEPYDILTIGDSFSNGQGGGKNPFYQDYIASAYDKKILNIQSFEGQNQIETVATLLNSGYLDMIKPKYIFIQCIERDIAKRFAKPQNMDISMQPEETTKQLLHNKPKWQVPTYGFINSGNYKFLAYGILRNFNDRAFFTECYSLKLNKEMFSVKNSDTLLVFHEDIKNNQEKSDANIEAINQNLNALQHKLASKDIKLVFLPSPDKYNLYYDFLVDKKYKNAEFFEKIAKLKKNYIFVDSKKILAGALASGEKDIYFADDTHWSHKASEIIVKEMNFLRVK